MGAGLGRGRVRRRWEVRRRAVAKTSTAAAKRVPSSLRGLLSKVSTGRMKALEKVVHADSLAFGSGGGTIFLPFLSLGTSTWVVAQGGGRPALRFQGDPRRAAEAASSTRAARAARLSGGGTSHAMATSVMAPPKTKMVKTAMSSVVCRV